MSLMYLHQHKDFHDLLLILQDEMDIEAGLIEKDYWIMHCLYGLKEAGYQFELKGGTSLSKGFGIIERFSEDIDIHIKPPEAMVINENPKNTNLNNVAKRKEFYEYMLNHYKSMVLLLLLEIRHLMIKFIIEVVVYDCILRRKRNT